MGATGTLTSWLQEIDPTAPLPALLGERPSVKPTEAVGGSAARAALELHDVVSQLERDPLAPECAINDPDPARRYAGRVAAKLRDGDELTPGQQLLIAALHDLHARRQQWGKLLERGAPNGEIITLARRQPAPTLPRLRSTHGCGRREHRSRPSRRSGSRASSSGDDDGSGPPPPSIEGIAGMVA